MSYEDSLHRARKDPGRNGPESYKSASQMRSPTTPSEASFSLDGSAVWVGDESGLDQMGFVATAASASSTSIASAAQTRGRRSTDASSSSSHGAYGRLGENAPSLTGAATAALKDSHFFHTAINYNEHLLPVKVPLSTFPEEVGEVRTPHAHPYISPHHISGLFDHALHDVFAYHHDHVGTNASTPAYKRLLDTAGNRTVQRAGHRKAHHLPGTS